MFKVSKNDENLMVELIDGVYAMDIEVLTRGDLVKEAKRIEYQSEVIACTSISSEFKEWLGE